MSGVIGSGGRAWAQTRPQHPEPGAAWCAGRGGAGWGSWGSITHTDEVPGSLPLEPGFLGEVTSVTPLPPLSPGTPSCADTRGAGQTLGKARPTEADPLITVTLLSAQESPLLPASLSAVRVLPAPASPVSGVGWGGALLIQFTGLSKKGFSIKTRFSHQKSWHWSSTFTEGKWQRTGCPARGGGASLQADRAGPAPSTGRVAVTVRSAKGLLELKQPHVETKW